MGGVIRNPVIEIQEVVILLLENQAPEILEAVVVAVDLAKIMW